MLKGYEKRRRQEVLNEERTASKNRLRRRRQIRQIIEQGPGSIEDIRREFIVLGTSWIDYLEDAKNEFGVDDVSFVFSNSLIIHEVVTQSACINSVRCMYVDTQ